MVSRRTAPDRAARPLLLLSGFRRRRIGWRLRTGPLISGKDAVIIVPQSKLSAVAATFQPFFASLGEPQIMTLGRRGMAEINLALVPAHGLTRPFPLPYPRSTGLVSGPSTPGVR